MPFVDLEKIAALAPKDTVYTWIVEAEIDSQALKRDLVGNDDVVPV